MNAKLMTLNGSIAGAVVAAVAAFTLAGCASSSARVADGHSDTPVGTATATATATDTVSSGPDTGGSSAAATGSASVAASAAASAASGAAGSASAQPVPSQRRPNTSGDGTAACANWQLRVSIKSAGFAGGHAGYVLEFTNTSSLACTVEGYPGAAVTDKPGRVVLNATRALSGYMSEGQYPAPHTITLSHGAAASTLLEWIDIPLHGETPSGANCPGMDGGELLVTPPNTTRSTAYPAPGVCSGSFLVHPLIAGSSGRLLAGS